jgi:hypothetical protein
MKKNKKVPLAWKFWNSSDATGKTAFSHRTLILFWAILACWAVATIYIETQLGWPGTRADLGHRVIGWFVNAILIRTFVRGIKRIQAIKETSTPCIT